MTDTNINIFFRAIDENVKKVLKEMQTASTATSTAMSKMVEKTREHVAVGSRQSVAVRDTSKAFESFSKSINQSGNLLEALNHLFPNLNTEVVGIQRVMQGYAKAIMETNKQQREFITTSEDGSKSVQVGQFALRETVRRTTEFTKGLAGLQVQMQRLNASDMPKWTTSLDEAGSNAQALAMQNHLLAGNIKTVGNELRFKNEQVMKEVGFNEIARKQLSRLNDDYNLYHKLVDKASTQSIGHQKAIETLGTSFGKTNKEVVHWGKTLTTSASAVDSLRSRVSMADSGLGKIAGTISTSAVAYGVLQGNIEIVGNRVRVLNKEGLAALPIHEKVAERMGILSKNYSVYNDQLSKVSNKSRENVNVFKSLATNYDSNSLALTKLAKVTNDADRVTGLYSASYKNLANTVGKNTTEGQRYLRQAQLVASEQNKLKVATGLLNGTYKIQNDRLINTTKNISNHKKALIETAGVFGKGSSQLKEYAKGLKTLGYNATDSTKHTRTLRNSFLETVKAVDHYRKAYPELTKDIKAVDVHQAKLNRTITQTGTVFKVHSDIGLKAFKSSRQHAQEMGILSKSYTDMERLVQRVTNVSAEHGKVISDLSRKYGGTTQNANLLSKAYKDADSESARLTSSLKKQRDAVLIGSDQYNKLSEQLKTVSTAQFVAQRTAENYDAAIKRSGIGVSKFTQFVQQTTDKLNLTQPLQQTFVQGMRSIGLESNATGIQLKSLGQNFTRVYESLLSMGARAGLSANQLTQLTTNTGFLKEATEGLNKTYSLRKGELYKLDDVTNKWLKTQVAVDQQGKASIETAKRMGVNQSTAYGQAEKAVTSWYETTNKAAKAVGHLRAQSGAMGGEFPKLAKQLDVTSVALGAMRGDIELVGNRIQVLNKSGMELTGYTEKQAQSLGILSKNYDAYHKALSKVTATNKENIGVFNNLAKSYSHNSAMMDKLPGVVSDLDQKSAQLSARWKDQARLVGENTVEGQRYLKRAEGIVTTQGKIWLANQQLNNTWDVQNGTLVNLTKTMNAHQKLMFNAANAYGKNTAQFTTFEKGLKSVGYTALDVSEKNSKLGKDFLRTFDTVERYKRLYPDLAKNMDAVQFYKAADGIKQVGNAFQISNKQGLDASRLTRDQLSQMGILSKGYDRMEGLIQRVAKEGSGHEKIIRNLADTYGYTNKNARLLSKAWDDAYGQSKLLTADVRQQMTTMAKSGSQYADAEKKISSYQSTTFLAQSTLANYKTSLDKAGVGVSAFSQHIAKASEKLKITGPLQDAYKRGLLSLGVTSRTAAHEVRTTGLAFSKVYEAMLQTGIQSKLTEQQLVSLMNNSKQLGTITKGLGTEYRVVNGAIQQLDKASGRWLQTQVKVDQQGKTSLVTTEKLAGNYATVGRQIGAVHGALSRVYAALRVTASYMVAGSAVYALMTTFISAKNAIFEFDQSLKNLQAITMATAGEVGVMERVMKKVATTTKFSASEIGEAMIYIGQAGFTAAESVQTIQAVANLATGTLSSLTESANLLTTTLRVFHLDASESARVADVFANAVNKSKTTIDKLNVTMNYLGPIAHSAGVSLEQSAAAIMVLSNAGIRASTVGTGFRQVLARLLKPTTALKQQMTKAGMSIDDFNIQAQNAKTGGQGFITVVHNLAQVLGGDVDKAFQGFGLRGANVALVLATLGDDIEFFVDQASEAGTAAKMAEIQMLGLQVSAKNLKDKLGLLAIEIGSTFRPAIMGVLDGLRFMADLFTEIFKYEFVKYVAAVAALTAAIMALNWALRMLVSVALFKFMGESVKSLMNMGTSVGIVSAAFDLFRQKVANAAANLNFLSTQSGVAALRVKDTAMQAGFLSTMVTAANVAVRNLWLTLKAHPLLLVAAAVASLVIAMYKLKQIKYDEIKANEENAIAAKQVADDYGRYAEQLSKVEQGSAEFYRIQGRIIEQFPELGKQARDAETNLAGFISQLKEVSREKQEEFLGRAATHFKNINMLIKENSVTLKNNIDVVEKSADGISLYNKNLEENKKKWWGMIGFGRGFITAVQSMTESLFKREQAIKKASIETAKATKTEREYARQAAIMAFNTDQVQASYDGVTESSQHYEEQLKAIVELGPAAERMFIGTYSALKKMQEIAKKVGVDLKDIKVGFQLLLGDFPDEAKAKWLGLWNVLGESGRLMLIESAGNLQEYRESLEKLNEEIETLTAEHIDRLVELRRESLEKELIKDQTEYVRKSSELMAKPYAVQSEMARRAYDKRMSLLQSELTALDKYATSYANSIKRIYGDMDVTIKDFYKEQHQIARNLYDAQLYLWSDLPKEMEGIMQEGIEDAYQTYLGTQKELYTEEYKERKSSYDSILSALKSNLADQRKVHEQANKDRKKAQEDLKKDLEQIEKDVAKNIEKIQKDLNKRIREINQNRIDLVMEQLSDEEKVYHVKKLREVAYYNFKQALANDDLERAQEYLDQLSAIESNAIEGRIVKEHNRVAEFIKDEKATLDLKMQWNKEHIDLEKELTDKKIEEAKRAGEESKTEREKEHDQTLLEIKQQEAEQMGSLQRQAAAYNQILNGLKAELDSLAAYIKEIQKIEIFLETFNFLKALEEVKKSITEFNTSDVSKITVQWLEQGSSNAIIQNIAKLKESLINFKQQVQDLEKTPINLDVQVNTPYGFRADGTPKGKGFLGKILSSDGHISTELSVTVNIDNKEVEIPLLVPTLSKEEIEKVVNSTEIPEAIMNKAIDHALMRMKKGLSPFLEEPITEVFDHVKEKSKKLESDLKGIKKATENIHSDVTVDFVGKTGTDQKGLEQLVATLQKEITTLKTTIEKLQTSVKTQINVETQKEDIDKIAQIQKLHDQLSTIYKKTTSIHKLDIENLDQFESVKELHEKLDKVSTESQHKVTVEYDATSGGIKPASYNYMSGTDKDGYKNYEPQPLFGEEKKTTPEKWRFNNFNRTITDWKGKTIDDINDLEDALQNGMRRFVNDVPSMWEIVELATYNTLDGLSDAFMDFFETGRLEWKSFISDILKEISRLLMQQAVGRGLAWLMPAVFGGVAAGMGGATAPNWGGQTTTAHKGLTPGKVTSTKISEFHNGLPAGKFAVPKLHKGLMNDEFPAILQKGERVVAKKEVHYEQKILESLHKMVKDITQERSNLSVSVPVNVQALEPRQQHLSGRLQSEVEQVVLRTIKEYAR